jgi:hypothetical protein
MNEPTLKLPRGADELLREFPGAEPDFEAQAKAIEARLKGSPGGIVFDDLLTAPKLAAEAGEPPLPSSVRAAPKSNFAEMARKSVQKKDDGAADAKELLAATAASRRPNAAMVERVRAAGRAPAVSTPLPKTDAAPEDAQRTSGVVARSASVARAAATPSTNRGTLIGIAGGLLALAAGVALFLRSGQPENQTSAAIAAQNAADAPVAAAPKNQAPAPAAETSNDGVVSPEALAAAPREGAREEVKGGAAKAAAPAGPAAAMAPAAKSAPVAGAATKPEAVVLEDDPAPTKPAERKPEAAAPEPPLKPAEGSSSGSVPLNPSAGAVSTALGSVRGGAQACLAGQTDAVTATVTFAADGHVLRVSASGPSAACIQAALSKAHIAPFAKESFTATTTIRPP